MSRHIAGLLLLVLSSPGSLTATLLAQPLVISNNGRTTAIIVISDDAGPHEAAAGQDLARYIGLMCGAIPPVANTDAAIKAALAGNQPTLLVGQIALRENPQLAADIRASLKKSPQLRIDGIGLRRQDTRLYLAGNNDLAHYFAVAELLRRWGCRWYLPTEFGECVPENKDLSIEKLDYVYSSPFEIRTYWLSWLGDNTGAREFRRHNMMTDRSAMPPTGHALGKHTKGLGKGTFHFPITAPETAAHVAGQLDTAYRDGKMFSLGMEDGSYDSDYPADQKLMKLQWDKYFMRWSVTDPMLELYNNVATILQEKYPNSNGKIGFLAYANMTIPPTRNLTAERSLFCELAPIDIDPIHGMDDPQSPPRREYQQMMVQWAKIMQGRLCIYDYDQGMLVWRDIPNPSHQAFAQDVKHYRRAGILGVNTESRGAFATTFLNLYFRSRLLWDPDADIDALLTDFYPRFYGPAAQPMQKYWSAIYDAWAKTICTEHEYFVAPVIYTPALIGLLRKQLQDAEQRIASLEVQGQALTRNEQQYVKRMRFTRTSFNILDNYIAMTTAAATNADYRAAVKAGEQGLKAREEMAAMGGIFTTTRLERGYPWWPGEVKQYRELVPYVDGPLGKLIVKTPLTWAFHRTGTEQEPRVELATEAIDLAYWKSVQATLTPASRKDYPAKWELLRTDQYAQAQGIRHPDRQSYTGHFWYRTDLTLTGKETEGAPHIRFPGLFNECWLYVNGEQVAHREQGKLWWRNDYRFEWDVELTGKLKAGVNTIALRCHCEHHLGGIFRRPFVYRAMR